MPYWCKKCSKRIVKGGDGRWQHETLQQDLKHPAQASQAPATEAK